ncbi:23S rRNA (guanosine(2251)-2'-O)-methyltransferase RlmB [Alicyclobacillus sp. SO9]|uniref:23S rRNA (guanosine(2251)-2'-O)-methyltransferase RlmB n=1 Tax=Alicyclobacillus sp. SO9 TaxID=2665646 RepID=UPI0018E7332B|nr:23S rRNA (guanosine(2251)-2'-O)-methyltransferase RlmB [Alicyclobacillus sp. SO9]QQE81465.1 23S rRNA (guanosine(2251)-2'-O)-methyltransferase RlmB [Alicyclobacillus sp. SO9]
MEEDIVAGRHPVLEALKSGRSINKLLVAEGAEGGSMGELLAKARERRIVVQRVPRSKLDSLAVKGHQGVVAYMAAHAYAELEDLTNRQTGQDPLIVLLDEINDPHNLGAIIRSCEAAGAQGVVISKRRAVALTSVVAKAAAGAVEYVPVARVSNLVQAMAKLKDQGYWIVGLDVEGKQNYTEVDYHGPVAMVIGAEGKGLSRLVKENCDYLVQLPMKGEVQSLNASVAAGVLLYEAVRQRQ